jgi:hypothetical protein
MSQNKLKDPAFLFYSQDFYTGVSTLNWEDRGKYITILCLMHQKGRMTEETICFLVGSVSVSLKEKFSIDENGFWFNDRLEKEAQKREKFVESRRNNGFKGGRRKKEEEPYGLPNAEPLGLATKNLPENENNIDNNTVSNTESTSTRERKQKGKRSDETIISDAKIFYDKETFENKDGMMITEYKALLNYIFKTNPLGVPAVSILALENQLTYEQFVVLLNKIGERNAHQIYQKVEVMMNTPAYLKDKKSLYMTLNAWFNREKKDNG